VNRLRRLLNTGYVGARVIVERRIPFWPIERVERLQRRRVRAIVRHAYETVPFYRDTMKERGLRPEDFESADDLARLPLLDGVTVRNDPDRFASTRYNDRNRTIAYTSGSTNFVQKKIYWGHDSMLARLAYSERDRVVLNHLLGLDRPQRQVYLFPTDSMVPVLRRFWDTATLSPPRRADRHILSVDLPLEEVVREIDTIEPDVVFSHGSYADALFRSLADRGTAFAAPRVWMYGADMLSAGAREIMEKRYRCLPWSTYQAGETGRIGFQCEHRRGFHLNLDAVAVRVTDDGGRSLAPGEVGEVVVSNLDNRAMVLLNYRLGDLGALSHAPCPCGRTLPLLESLEGRRSEMVQVAGGREVTSLILDSSFEEALHDTIQIQMSQAPDGSVGWRLVPCAHVDRERMRAFMLERSTTVFGPKVQVSVEFVDHIPGTRAGKFQRVIHE